jgi:AbrB family looped-hinge helix DNA binding protein
MSSKPHVPLASPAEPIITSSSKAPKHPRPSKELVCGVLAESVLTSKGQVTIPQAIRAKFQLDAGDSLVWRQEADGRLFVEPKRTLSLADIRAAIAAAGIPVPPRAFSVAEMDEAIGQELESKYGRH